MIKPGMEFDFGEMPDFGAEIKKVRLKHKLTQAQFAEIIGKSPSTVHGYENNTIIPPFKVLLTISELFHIPVGTLMGVDNLKENFALASDVRAVYDLYIKLIGEDIDE